MGGIKQLTSSLHGHAVRIDQLNWQENSKSHFLYFIYPTSDSPIDQFNPINIINEWETKLSNYLS